MMLTNGRTADAKADVGQGTRGKENQKVELEHRKTRLETECGK